MIKGYILSFLSVMIFFLSSCQGQDTFYSSCEGKYGSQKVIDSIESILSGTHVNFRMTYKDSIRMPKNCDTIRMHIQTRDKADIVSADTFVQTISSIFFNDTSNSTAKYLCLTVRNSIPMVGKVEAKYVLDRFSANNNNALNTPIDTTNNRVYNIVNAFPYESFTAAETIKGMQIDVNIVTEPSDVNKLAAEIRQKYINEIHEKSLVEFSIKFFVEKPNNKYCVSKVYSVFYGKANKNL